VPNGFHLGLARVDLHIAGHPLPDAHSLAAGAAVLERVRATPPDVSLLFLISGGASSLVELPTDGVTLADVIAWNAWLVGSGLPISAVNAVRGRFSQLKAGRLAQHVAPRRALALMISDVPHDDPAVIGSGLLIASPDASLPAGLPDAMRERIDALPASPTEPAIAVPTAIVARPEDFRDAAAAEARRRGFQVEAWPERFDGDATRVAGRAAERLARSRADLIVAVGESTVQLPRAPGRGGRNQHLALAAARHLAGRPLAVLLAAGSDGTDGPTEDAGAIVDDGTVDRGQLAGLDPGEALARAAAGEFLEASGDLYSTGPTGTNVGDVLIGLTTRGARVLEQRDGLAEAHWP
ncbi:MAG TPA: DUF4147 domain-containing protein, partial [Steroidobacteraceae bacterium]|nr:DUF4147 domain-containing protein [Steroidobacteraceae bacterium]